MIDSKLTRQVNINWFSCEFILFFTKKLIINVLRIRIAYNLNFRIVKF